MTEFTELNLVGPLLRAIEKQGFSEPTQIQSRAIPALMDGADLMGVAETGGGKTAAFVLPLLQRLQHERRKPKPNKPTAVILAPTRELAMQIGLCIRVFTRGMKLFHTVVYGGAPYGPQLQQLSRGVDILVATPGRLLDHMKRGTVQLDNVETIILDEADRMLDMGFIEDVTFITDKLPEEHQTVMFSATMSPAIRKLSEKLLTNPEFVEIARKTAVAEGVDHSVLMVRGHDKKDLLMHLLADPAKERVIVFVRTKATADTLATEIETAVEGIKTAAIHGDLNQRARERTLRSFKNGRFSVLVATDVAARGIDVNAITHVINYDLPMEAENYIHRVGRTGRAGATGIAISICEPRERNLLRNIEQIIKQKVRIDEDHPFPAPASKPEQKKHRPGRKGRPARAQDDKKPTADVKPFRKRPKNTVSKNKGKPGFKSRKSANPAANAQNKRPDARKQKFKRAS
ncbi:MAG: DEAD/DEAH box helicase [Sneathiella sp.]|uniref:DEAD/DEAH box helicase n=1 Tax=Sneathiella sp. TaxID=1964365 RepID=UPI000C607957|nr:DEAD/DEAH box helicase [Sneathiella sp.]MAZ02787.1 DEAD/DEAH box helicase [Sneathiella sp.]